MTELIRAEAVSAGYGSQPVIHELNLVVNPGEVVLLLGPNGAGKTTSMLALSGVLPPLSGSVYFDGKPVRSPLYKRARRGLAFVTEERSVFKTMSTADNLRCGNVSADDVCTLFPELRRSLGVRGGLLSGGEQQMLSLGRALSRSPRLLLADELSLGLAPLIVTRLFDAVKAATRTGTGVLLVEQHARVALRYADRVYVMERGRIKMDVSSVEALERIDEIQGLYLASAT